MADNDLFLRNLGIKPGMVLVWSAGNVFIEYESRMLRLDNGDSKIFVEEANKNWFQAMAMFLAVANKLKLENRDNPATDRLGYLFKAS